jgi:hypothetical protein
MVQAPNPHSEERTMSLTHEAALAVHRDRHQRFLADAADDRLVRDVDVVRPRRTRRQLWLGLGRAVRGVFASPLTPQPNDSLRSIP